MRSPNGPPARVSGSGGGSRWVRCAPVFLAACALATSCKKETESLVVVALTAAPADTTLTTVSITVGSVKQTFSLPSGEGLSATAKSFGVYLPSSVTGQIAVKATATGGDAAACAGYLGNNTVFVLVGGTSNVDIAMVPGNTCPSGTDGGTDGGAHGSSPPSLANCTEYVHNVNPAAACVSGDSTTDVVLTDIAFSHSGKLLFTAGEDNRVKVWTWDAANLNLTAEGHELDTSGLLTYVAISPNDKLVAAGSSGGRLTVWNVGGTWPIAANLTGITGDIYGVAFSPDSQTLYAIDSDGNLTSYVVGGTVSPTTLKALSPFALPYVLATSTTESDGSYWLGIGYGDGSASITKVVSGVLGTEMGFTVTSTDAKGVYTIGFSKDGTMVESGAEDGTFGIWDVPLPTPIAPRMPKIAIVDSFLYGAAFHPSGATIALGAGVGSNDPARQLGIWTIATGQALSTVSNTTLSYSPSAVAFSPDGTTLAAGERACGKFIVCAD
jgi:WD40 repeat protein